MLSNIQEQLTMILASLVKKTLLLFRYPSFASNLIGPHQEIAVLQTRLGVACQIHYPCRITQRPCRRRPYFRKAAVQGLCDYTRVTSTWLDVLSHRHHPCHDAAEPEDHRTFPLVLFSHGLGGCMEMYTQLCQQIASQGYIVVAMEHEDGSGCYAENVQGEVISYKRPDDRPYSREKVLEFRQEFLEQRVLETLSVLKEIDGKVSATQGDLVERIFRQMDTAHGYSLIGHSFGGASMILTAQHLLASSSSSSSGTKEPASLSVLDPWAFSLPDHVLDEGSLSSLPTLSILSESWESNNPETAFIDRLLTSHEMDQSSYYAPRSVHASFADSVSWFPSWVLRKLRLRGVEESREETIRATAQACHERMRRRELWSGKELEGLLRRYPKGVVVE